MTQAADSSTSAVAIIILAAGRSSRMGALKLLLPLGGQPVIKHVVGAALATPLRPVVVVLGHAAPALRAALPQADLTVVENAAYAAGQSTSLHAALDALPASAAGALVLLGDQPLISAGDIMRLAATAASGAPVVAASYGGRRGNPVYFARACFAELRAVTGDVGGREVIERHRTELTLVPMDDADAALDLDTPDAYAQVQTIWARRRDAPR